ncbi:hypothetical protein [Absidia glauca]|uniref:NADH:flavin oxidoreductase/NADH oxidase N-terminal domain-containing protein n=1 Tax=Absidia glauca TaxID=4829 RepID=A0A163J5K1_ABSGL|nr:hypothetical protein [Absidia glauca]
MSQSKAAALFTPIKIGHHLLRHRVVMAPMTRFRSSQTGVPSDLVSQYYGERATSGGLLITEATAISPYAGGYPGTPGIHTTEHIEAWKNTTEAVHKVGGAIFMQLWHLGRTSFSAALPNGDSTVSASVIAIKGNSPMGVPYELPRALAVDEIKSISGDFAQAAKNAVSAGFDGVEIHSANGYLLDQFINTSSNKRTDQYGGSIENRTRFPLEVVDAVVQAVGADKTGIRFSPYSSYQDMGDDTPVDTWSHITRRLENKHPDLAYVHFVEPSKQDATTKGASLDPFRKLWSGPFISAGNYTDDTQAAYDRAESSPNNLVAVGRSFLSNPDLVERYRNYWNLNPYKTDTFYSPGPVGYVDYPQYTAAETN